MGARKSSEKRLRRRALASWVRSLVRIEYPRTLSSVVAPPSVSSTLA